MGSSLVKKIKNGRVHESNPKCRKCRSKMVFFDKEVETALGTKKRITQWICEKCGWGHEITKDGRYGGRGNV